MRLGRDKTQLPWGEGTLLDHAVARLAQVCPQVWVCVRRSSAGRKLPAGASGCIPDAAGDAGPLAGIVAALEHTTTDWNLLFAVDMPFVPVTILSALAARAGSSSHDCVLAVGDSRPQPLCGLYHRRLASGLRQSLEQGTLKVMTALQQAGGAPDSFHPQTGSPSAARWWRNINTAADWQEAQRLAGIHPEDDDSAAGSLRLS
jgi:molybdopterin-guanine dinucleotide biosynthesis protein A